MATAVKEMMEKASAKVPRVTPAEARALIGKGAVVIDVGDAPEVEKSGKVMGATHILRCMLEFRANPQSAS